MCECEKEKIGLVYSVCILEAGSLRVYVCAYVSVCIRMYILVLRIMRDPEFQI